MTPAPGEHGKLPFWKAPGPGRPVELGLAIGRFTRELRSKHAEEALTTLREDLGLDERAAANLVNYVDEQTAVSAVPDDRTIVVERFRDELGDWRVCILSPIGARVLTPWALAIEARLQERLGPGAQVLWSDDGIVIRLPEAVDSIPLDDLLFTPEEIEEAVVATLPGTALFASIFREASARALLLPRRMPGRRTALWQQRQRSADLLSAAGRYPEFPMLLEATRECLRDHFDVPALQELMASLAVTPHEDDRGRHRASVAVRTVAAVRLDRGVHVRGRRTVGGAARGGAVAGPRPAARPARLRRSARAARPGRARRRRARAATPRRRAAGSLPRRGPRPAARPRTAQRRRDRGAGRPPASDAIDTLVAEHRAFRVTIAGVEQVAAAEDAGRLRAALGATLPDDLPSVFAEAPERPIEDLVARYARTHGPFVTADIARRLGIDPDRVRQALEALVAVDRVVHGEFRPGGFEREWCDANVLRRIRRRSLAALRREVEPVDAAAFARFLPAWQGADRPRGGTRRADPGAAAPAGRGHPRLDPRARRAARSGPGVPPGRPRRPDGERRARVDRSGGARDRRRARHVAVPGRRRPRSSRSLVEGPAGPVHDAIRSHLAGSRSLVLARPRAGGGHGRYGGAVAFALGSGLGRRGHERHARAAARVRAFGPSPSSHRPPDPDPDSSVARDRPPAPDGGRWSPIFVLRRSAPPSAPSPAPSGCSIATAS